MKKINEGFICINCKKEIPATTKTCRNHCPHCFTSLHVDLNIPGDRKSNCKGKMFPISYEIRNNKFKILFKCTQCQKEHRNKKADDDEIIKLDGIIKNAICNS
ncbi:MAG: RNHCP domain-containing protein [Candidatus Absconditabacterales bacterium]